MITRGPFSFHFERTEPGRRYLGFSLTDTMPEGFAVNVGLWWIALHLAVLWGRFE
jgi:hypothetical protein